MFLQSALAPFTQHVRAAAGGGLGEPLHPVAARATGGQQEHNGKDEKDRKDIRFSVHRLTTFLFHLYLLRCHLACGNRCITDLDRCERAADCVIPLLVQLGIGHVVEIEL